MEKIASAASGRGCALEINAEPDRLDLNDIHAHMAKSKGVKFAISTDAHSVNAFEYMRFGADQARRAWMGPGDVLNIHPLAQLRSLLRRRDRAASKLTSFPNISTTDTISWKLLSKSIFRA